MALQFNPGTINEKSCFQWSVNLACGDLTCTEKGWGWGK